MLFRAAQLLEERKDALAREMTREMGKVLEETRGDVQEAIDMTSSWPARDGGYTARHDPSELPNKFAMWCVSPRRLRAHHAVELPDGDSVLEDYARARLRQHRRDQTGDDHAALDF